MTPSDAVYQLRTNAVAVSSPLLIHATFVLEQRIRELEEAIGVCVPTICRVFIDYSKKNDMGPDVELGEAVLTRVEKAMKTKFGE